ncbi:MAG: TIGR03936 family radical SAM-associated protein [Candidatus Omnitrophota bacterium]
MEYGYFFQYGKAERMIYISHLDLLRLLGRAARRAQLPVALTEGFHRHLKIKLHHALKLGLEAQGQTGEIILKERWEEESLRQRWQAELPEGVLLSGMRFTGSKGGNA